MLGSRRETPPGAQDKPPPLPGAVGAGSFPAPSGAPLCANNQVFMKPHRGKKKEFWLLSIFINCLDGDIKSAPVRKAMPTYRRVSSASHAAATESELDLTVT